MKRIDYKDITDSLVSILSLANTTTAAFDLSYGLTERIKTISVKDAFIEPVMEVEYPYVFVSLESKTSEHADFGGNRINDDDILKYKIFVIMDDSSYDTARADLLNGVRNVESNISLNRTIGNYQSNGVQVIDSHVDAIDFSVKFGEDSPYNRSASMDLSVKLNVKDL